MYVEDHTSVCFSSSWLSVKLLLILRHHSTGLKEFERNKRSVCSNYSWETLKYTPNVDLTTFSLHGRLRQSENDSELRFSFLNTFWTAFLKEQKNNSNIKKTPHVNLCRPNTLVLSEKWKTFCRVAFVIAERKELVGHSSQETCVFISSWTARFLCDLATPPYLRFPFVMLDNIYLGEARMILCLQKLFAAPCWGGARKVSSYI